MVYYALMETTAGQDTVNIVLWMPGCLYLGAHTWVVGIASQGSIFTVYKGQLVTVEASGHPKQPSSIQLNAVVKYLKQCLIALIKCLVVQFADQLCHSLITKKK